MATNPTQPNLTPTDPSLLGGQPGSYCIPQLTLVCWVVARFLLLWEPQNIHSFLAFCFNLNIYIKNISTSFDSR